MSVSYGGVVTSTIQIPDGNYNLIDGTMTTALKAALNDAIPGNTFVVEYSTVTNKLIFTAGTSFSFNFSKSLPSDTNCGAALAFPYSTCWGLGYYLGFQQTTRTAVASGGSYVLTSDFAANADPTTYILMEIANLNKNDESSIDNRRSGTIDGSFAKIPLDGNSGDYVFLTDTGSYPLNRHVYQPPVAKLNTLQVKFRYHDGRVVDFNGTEHSFTLELELLDNNFDEFSSVEFGM